MGSISFPMSDLYGGFAGTTEMTIPDNDDKNALVDTNETGKRSVEVKVNKASNKKLYLSLLLVLIIVVVIGGRF